MKPNCTASDYRTRQIFRLIAIGLVGISLVLAWVSSIRVGDSVPSTSLIAGVILLALWGYLEVIWKRQAKVRWRITKKGLYHVASGSQDTILWSDIQDIRWQVDNVVIRYHKHSPSEVGGEQVVVLDATEKECAWLQKLWRAQLEADDLNRSSSVLSSRFQFGLSMMVAVCGAVLLGFVVTRLHLYWDASAWPSTEGSITGSEIREIPRKRGKSVVSEIRVTFNYAVAGIDYQSDRIKLFSRSSRMETDAAASFLAQHQKGQRVTVYYDSDRHDYGVLTREPDWLQIGCLFGMSLCLLYLGIGLVKQQISK